MARWGGELSLYRCKCCVLANKLYCLWGNSQPSGAAGNFKEIIPIGGKSAGRGDIIKLFTNLFSIPLLLVPGWQGPDLIILVLFAPAKCSVNICRFGLIWMRYDSFGWCLMSELMISLVWITSPKGVLLFLKFEPEMTVSGSGCVSV